MRDKKTKPSNAAATPVSVIGFRVEDESSRQPSQEAGRLLSLATSQLHAIAKTLPEIERSTHLLGELAARLDRELADLGLNTESVPVTPPGVGSPNAPLTWRAMSDTERTQQTIRFLVGSLNAFLTSWEAYHARLVDNPKQLAGAVKRIRLLETDLDKALTIVRDRQQEATRLKSELSQAQLTGAERAIEVERLQRAVQHLHAQLDESRAFSQMLAGSTTWKLARALMIPARFAPPIIKRLGRGALRRLVALLQRFRRLRESQTARAPKADFSRNARRRPEAAIAGGLDIIIALPGGETPTPELLDRWITLAGPRTTIVVCAPAPSSPPPQVAFVPVPAERDLVDHIDNLIRCAVSSTAVVVTVPSVPDAAALETFATIFSSHHRVIAACGILVGSDGRIRSAGMATATDGDLLPAGADEPADGYAWSSVSRVEVLSSPIVAFDVDAYVHVGGMTSHPHGYAGALAEFSAEARRRALQVVHNPFAQFAASPESPAPTAVPGRARSLAPPPQKRVLFADAAAPAPDRDSGSMDLVWYMRIFQDMGYQVTFLPHHERRPSRQVDDLRRMGVLVPLQAEFAEAWHFLRDHGSQFDIIFLSRVTVACHLIGPAKEFAPRAKIIFDTVDLHFLREERAAALAQSETLKAQAERTRHEEFRTMDLADVTIVRSAVEAERIRENAPSIHTHVVPIVRPVGGRLAPLEGRFDMMFVGGFQHAPNLDAFELLHGEIWPRIRAQLPDARLHIIGSGAPPTVINRHDPGAGFLVEGYVADLDEFYRKMRVNLAPLRYGAGLKGKLVASLANGVPSVATEIAAEGMGLENDSTVLLASDPVAFADAAVRLYTDDWLWTRLSDRGIAFAEQKFSVPVVRRTIESMVGEFSVR